MSDEVVSLEEHLSEHIETIEADLERKNERVRALEADIDEGGTLVISLKE